MEWTFDFYFEDGQPCGSGWLPMTCDLDCIAIIDGDRDGWCLDGFRVCADGTKWFEVPREHPLWDDLSTHLLQKHESEITRDWDVYLFERKAAARGDAYRQMMAGA